MRRLVVFLVLFGFALQGLSALAAMTQSCPMAKSHLAAAVSKLADSGASALEVVADDGCCADFETWARTGNPCIDEQSCQTGQPTALVPHVAGTLVVESHRWQVHSNLVFPPPDSPASVWRPPQFI